MVQNVTLRPNEEAISDLLKLNCIIECETKPRVVNPLTVASNTPHKKRLVLDLRHINIHVWKEHTKYENYTTLSNYLADVHYMITFDLKSGYHHIEASILYCCVLLYVTLSGRCKWNSNLNSVQHSVIRIKMLFHLDYDSEIWYRNLCNRVWYSLICDYDWI